MTSTPRRPAPPARAGSNRSFPSGCPSWLRSCSPPGTWSAKVVRACQGHRTWFSTTARHTQQAQAAIAGIGEAAGTPIDYPDSGVAQVAEATLAGHRLVVRRARLAGSQATLWPDRHHHAFVADRRHAVCELADRRWS